MIRLKHDFTLVLSRTDSIGDTILTLPLAGMLKKNFPGCRIVFLGRSYTRDVVAVCRHINAFLDYDELSKMPLRERVARIRKLGVQVFIHVFPVAAIAILARFAGAEHRVGTRSRWYHWLTCNHLLRLHRKNSTLHEAQLNMTMLRFLGVPASVELRDIPSLYGFTNVQALGEEMAAMIDQTKVNVILHPKSKGSAVEWGLNNFSELITLLGSKNYKVFVSGTEADGASMQGFLQRHPEVINLCGLFSLREFIAFIAMADVLVAASTGPLHIASALGIKAIGLYSSRRPIFPQRWAPLGEKAHALVRDPDCRQCQKGSDCECIRQISADRVKQFIDQ